MLKRLKNLAFTSRMWLSAGVFCLGMSIVLGYHQDQVIARNALAAKVGIPQTVMIQDFSQSMHSNLLHEVHLLGEVALPQIITTNIGTESAPNWIQLLPVYPVGADVLPLATKFLADATEGPRRPMPRSERFNLRAKAARMRPLESHPMGIVLIEAGVSIEEAVLYRTVGHGENGPLVSLTGAFVADTGFQQSATQAFKQGALPLMADVPLIVPYNLGQRAVAAATDYDSIRSLLRWAALVMILVGIASTFQVLSFLSRKPKVQPVFEKVEAIGAFPGVFQAIRTQEDLVREEQEEAERSAAASRRAFSRINYG